MSGAPTTGGAGLAWSSNTTLAEIAESLRAAQRVVLLTHSKPDGDAVGATLALARTLERLGVTAHVAYTGPWSGMYDGVVGATKVIRERHRWGEPPFSEADRVVVVDTGSWSQLTEAKPFLEPRRAMTTIVDHHAHGNPDVADARYIELAAASCCEIVADLCLLLLGLGSAAALPVEVAEPLYIGVATDTGWFRYSNTTARTMRLAGDLIDAGVQHNLLYQQIEQSDKPARLRLMAKVLNSVRLHDNNRIAIMTLTRKDLEETGAAYEDVSGLTDLPQTVASIRVVALVTELEPKLCKVSFRSKAGAGSVDVNRVAQTLNGGGHKHAAGAKIHKPLDEAVEAVLAALLAAGEP